MIRMSVLKLSVMFEVTVIATHLCKTTNHLLSLLIDKLSSPIRCSDMYVVTPICYYGLCTLMDFMYLKP